MRDKIKIRPARYRSEAELLAWLQTQPISAHQWAREQLARGKLSLDSSRSYQSEALDEMAAPGWYAFQWCNGASKTATAALFVLFFLDNYADGMAITTAGTWSQLKEQLWREIPYWAKASKGRLTIQAAAQGVGKTQIDIGPKWAAFGRAANKPATFEGIHAQNLLILIDEAKALKPGFLEEIRRLLRGNPNANVWWICLSSPGSPSGPFFDITQGEQAHFWKTFKLSAYETERVDLDLVGRDAVDIGEKSPLFVSMNCGEWPDEAEDTIVPMSIALANVGRKVETKGPRGLGVDVARSGGSETVFGDMMNRRFRIPIVYKGKRTTVTAGHLAQIADQYGAIFVDDPGIGGAVIDMALEEGLQNVYPYNGGLPASDKRFFDINAETAFAVRRELEKGADDESGNPNLGFDLPSDKLLLHQLSTRKLMPRRDGRIQVESKIDMSARNEKSPDRSDTLQMAWYARNAVNIDSVLTNEPQPTTAMSGARSQL